jgi:hypothetical protein
MDTHGTLLLTAGKESILSGEVPEVKKVQIKKVQNRETSTTALVVCNFRQRGDRQRTALGINDQFQPADMTAIAHAWPGTLFELVVRDLELAGGATPGHEGWRWCSLRTDGVTTPQSIGQTPILRCR